MAGNTHVPDKLEGYMLQVRHALFELISVDDRIVSVEAYDDVAIETDEIKQRWYCTTDGECGEI